MYSDRDVTSRPLIVILEIKLGCSGDREEAATLEPTIVHATVSGWPCVSLGIHNKSEPLVDSVVGLSERRGLAGHCPSYINA